MISPQYLAALRVIVERLAGQPIDWAVTGSCGFALQGLDVTVHDIDVQTDSDGAYAIERALADRRGRAVAYSAAERIRSHFGALEIDGVTIEIMGGIQKRLGDGTWEPPVDIRPHRRWVAVDGMSIPVLALEYEYTAYLALGRAEQVVTLKTWIEEHSHANNRPRPE